MAKQRTALVVEDNALVAMDARDMLETLGFAPVHVINSAEFAASLVRDKPLTLALLVTHLHGGDTASLAALLADFGVPFGFVSDFVDGQDRPSQFFGRPFVTKPYLPADLVAMLGRLGIQNSICCDGAAD